MARKKEAVQTDEAEQTEVKVIRITRTLPVLLTAEEMLDRGARAAHLDRREEEITAAANAAKSDYKHQLEAVVAERRLLQERIRSKQEHRDVSCEERHVYRTGKVVVVRCDTGEQIDERPMTDAERQTELPMDCDLEFCRAIQRKVKLHFDETGEPLKDVELEAHMNAKTSDQRLGVSKAVREMIMVGSLVREDFEGRFAVTPGEHAL